MANTISSAPNLTAVPAASSSQSEAVGAASPDFVGPQAPPELRAGVRGSVAAQPQRRPDPAADGSASPPSAADLAAATQNISEFIQTVSRSLSISIDDTLETPVITVRNSETEEVIRQIPSEEALEISRFIADQRTATRGAAQGGAAAARAVTGLLFNDSA
jgi:flagellar protein FlaG